MQLRFILPLLSIFLSYNFSLSDAGLSNSASLEIEDEFSSCNILKSKYEILKLRLELIEKFGNYVPEIDKKLKALDTKIENLYESLALYRGSSSGEVQNYRYIALERHDGGETSTHATIEAENLKLVTDTNTDRAEENKDKLYLTNIDEDEPKVCKTNENGNPICSKIDLSPSCSGSNALMCTGDKCRIKVNNMPSFKVLCHDDWIVIQRRINGSVDFNNDWQSYKNGFGDLNGEFWLGLDKIHALTKALAPAELLIEMKDFNDVEKYAKYETFSIGSESDNYRLAPPGTFSGDARDSLDIHRDEAFTTYDKDNDKSSSANCAQAFTGGWWFFDCGTGQENSNLNGQYFGKESSTNIARQNGIKWSTFGGGTTSLKSVQMMIRKNY